MYQVTILYLNNAEVGYAEGEDYESTVNDALEQVSNLEYYDPADLTISAVKEGSIMAVSTPYDIWAAFTQ